MFSDRFRILIIMVLAAAILGGCFYAAWMGPQVDPEMAVILSDLGYLGREVTARYATVEAVQGRTATLKSMGHEFNVELPAGLNLVEHQDFSFTGTVLSGNTIRVNDYHQHLWRPFKYYFSLPALAFVIYLLFRYYRFDGRSFIFSERSKP